MVLVQALNNGVLVDPHDPKAIEDALLKLVADKNLWLECRKNGLKNIHRFSWTEHCRNYLSHVEHCRNRHPTTRLEIMPIPEEPLSDSLKDVQDLSLRFSVEATADLSNIPADQLDAATRQKELIEAITRSRNKAISNGKAGAAYCPGRRQRLFVIATDCYNEGNGDFAESLLQPIMRNVTKAAGLGGRTGFVLVTGSSLGETVEALKRSQVNVQELDALVCSSGSELYYPWMDLVADADYESHIEYRWGGENVRPMVTRLARDEGADEDDIQDYAGGSNTRCYSYNLKPGAKVSNDHWSLMSDYYFEDQS